ncbi:MAG: nuclear transport factor 2 family protein [Myxococcota bacterium]
MSDLEAHEAIRRLMAIYAQLLDSKRLEEWGQLFTPDAVFQVWGQVWRGRDAIVAGIGGMQPDLPGKHVILTPVVDLNGPDRARAWTDLSAFATTDEGISIATIGRYHDELVRQDGRWRFARRVVVMAREALPEGVEPSPAF